MFVSIFVPLRMVASPGKREEWLGAGRLPAEVF